MSAGILLIVGLGNPGAEYEKTRHNAGAWFVSDLADKHHVTLRTNPKFFGQTGSTRIDDQDCHFLIPNTYMNLSGQAVQALSHFYKIPPQSILIAHDELDIPVGEIRLKFDGGHGGHNGLRDISQRLNTKAFYRLRIGIGHPGASHQVTDYVLSPPNKADRGKIDVALQEAEQTLPLLLQGEFQKAMQSLHTN